MTDLERWLDANDRFLATSLAWLRHRMESLASPGTAATSTPSASMPHSGGQAAPGASAGAASGSALAVTTRPGASGMSPAVDAVTRPADAPVGGHGRSRSLLTRIWGSSSDEEEARDARALITTATPLSPASASASPAPAAFSTASPSSSASAASSPSSSSAPSTSSTDASSVAGGAVSSGSPLLALDPASTDPPPALVLLARRLGLTEFESHVLLLCAAMELDTRTGTLCARAMQDAARPFPTFALALSLFDRPAWDAMSPERPLRYWRLLEINQPGAQPLVTSALKVDERIVNYLKGLNYLDDRLAPLVTPVPRETVALPASQQQTSDILAEHLARVREGTHPPLLQLLGTDSQSKLLVAERAASRLGLLLHRVSADVLPSTGADLETFARLWQREGALLPLALYIDAADVDRTTGPVAGAVQRLCKRGMGVVFLDTRQQWPDLGRDALAFDVTKPTAAEQHAAWMTLLGESGAQTAGRLAGQFNFNLPSIQTIAAGAHARAAAATERAAAQAAASAAERTDARAAGAADPATFADPARALDPDRLLEPAPPAEPVRLTDIVWSDSLRHARPALDQLAQPLDPKARWEDLELAPAEKSLLRQISQQVSARLAVYDAWGFRERMNRGLGISVLFAGDSGTGKTMAAEVLANDLALMLYRIDLSSVVSKYIGETERNLRKLFDAAEDGGAILFFDEADALFGKRSEVKDSHDRYANIEINYLLQRMETYRGLAILATNMKSALDSAFMRRLRFIVNFPFPGQAERLAIWRRAFPARAPQVGLDYVRLARFNVTGGSIHNIALNAAFLAAHAGEPITMRLVLDAVRNEYRKLEKPINEAEFRWLEATPAAAAGRGGAPGTAGSGTGASTGAGPAASASAASNAPASASGSGPTGAPPRAATERRA